MAKTSISLKFLVGFWLLVAALTPWVTNDVPILCKSESTWTLPFLQRESHLAKVGQGYDCAISIGPIRPYHAQTINMQASLQAPSWRHILGTDRLGRDVLAGMSYGLYKALCVGLIAVFISTFIGIIFGGLAGYYGDHMAVVNPYRALMSVMVFGIVVFWCIRLQRYVLPMSVIYIVLCTLVGVGLTRYSMSDSSTHSLRLPLDSIIMRSVERYQSLPGLLLILFLLNYLGRTTAVIMGLIIGLLSVPTMIRVVRGEIRRFAAQDFARGMKGLGFDTKHIWFHELLPHARGPLVVVMSFSFASAILLESTLSFLGLGLPLEEVTWGSMLNEGRKYLHAWWLVLFPGLAITTMIYILLSAGRQLILDQSHSRVRL